MALAFPNIAAIKEGNLRTLFAVARGFQSFFKGDKMSLDGACRVVQKGGVGESGSNETMIYQLTGTLRKNVVLRNVESSLCPNTGACAVLLVNGEMAATSLITNEGSTIQVEAGPGDQVIAIVQSFPLFNDINCIRLGELNVELQECDLVGRNADDMGSSVLDLPSIQSRNWYAWNNQMPPKPDDFHIVGEVDVPNPGVDVELTARVPQGINPDIFIADLIFVQRPGIWPQVVATKQVRFDRVLVNSNYKEVQVFVAKKLIVKIPVETIV